MKDDMIDSSLNYWEDNYKNFNHFDTKYGNWLNDFSEIIEKCQTPIIDLGCGHGNTTYYLINNGKKVIACDYSKNSLLNTKHNVKGICYKMF